MDSSFNDRQVNVSGSGKLTSHPLAATGRDPVISEGPSLRLGLIFLHQKVRDETIYHTPPSRIQDSTTMPKRKREGSAEDAAAPVGAKAQRITFKLNQAAVKVGHAFKVAKGFERQKLGRRQKQAKQNSDAKAAERIENEIEALKVRCDKASARADTTDEHPPGR